MTVTVVIPTHNRPQLLAQAIESAATQTHPPAEIIISDNGITEETERVVREAKAKYETPIAYIKQSSPVGFWENWRTGVDHVETPWVKILADDDRLKADCLEKQLAISDGKTLVQCAAHMDGQTVYAYTIPSPRDIAAGVAQGLVSANPVTSLIQTDAVREGWEMFGLLSERTIESLCGPNLLLMYGATIRDWSRYANTAEALVEIDGFTGEGENRSYTLRLMETDRGLWQQSYQEAYQVLNDLAGSL